MCRFFYTFWLRLLSNLKLSGGHFLKFLVSALWDRNGDDVVKRFFRYGARSQRKQHNSSGLSSRLMIDCWLLFKSQVLEDVSLPANSTLPSYVISHGGLAGMRIRIPNGTTWSDALPLEHVEGNGKGQHLIVQVIKQMMCVFVGGGFLMSYERYHWAEFAQEKQLFAVW